MATESHSLEPAESPPAVVVVGAGALGIYLAHAWQNACFPIAGIWNRTGYAQIEVTAQGGTSLLQCRRIGFVDASFLQEISAQHLHIFVCIPLQNFVCNAASLLRGLAAGSFRSVTVVLCSNGIANDAEILQELHSIFAGVADLSLLRALFYVGLVRSVVDDLVTVKWNGGHLVRWGELYGSSRRFVNALSFQHQPGVDQRNSLYWEWAPSIQRVECAKFFVNLVLGFGVGPRAISNGNLSQVLSESRQGELATAFVELFPKIPLKSKEVLEELRMTVLATANNVNSISLAWSAGRLGFVEEFRTQLRALAAATAQRQIKQLWYEFAGLSDE